MFLKTITSAVMRSQGRPELQSSRVIHLDIEISYKDLPQILVAMLVLCSLSRSGLIGIASFPEGLLRYGDTRT